jgi:carboxylesterase
MHHSHPITLPGTNGNGVLLLHGFTGNPDVFRELAANLNEAGYTVRAPLIAGHGTTPQELSETTWNDWYDSAEESFQDLQKETKKQFIVGASFGSCLACILASNHQVAGLVTIGYPRWIRHDFTARLATGLLRLFGVRYFKKKIRLNDNTLLVGAPGGNYPIIPIVSLSNFFHLKGVVSEQALSKIKSPLLIIQSTRDGLVLPKSGFHLFSRASSEHKQLLWISEPHHRLHVGKERHTIYTNLREFMIRWS